MMPPPQMHYNGHFTEPYTSSQGNYCAETNLKAITCCFTFFCTVEPALCCVFVIPYPSSCLHSHRQPLHEQSERLLLSLSDQPRLLSAGIQQQWAVTQRQRLQRPQHEFPNQPSTLPSALPHVLQPLHHQRHHQARLRPLASPQRSHPTLLPRHPRL